MACQAMHFWTFTGLVGAFLDLIIAYFLLSASTIAFFASKFLGFFGLSLPCPCDGLFSSHYCFKTLLVDYPTENVSSVQLSVRSKFPFDSILAKDQNCNVNMRLDEDGNCVNINGSGKLEGEASCNSQNVGFGKEREYDIKGKGVTIQRQPRGGGFRRRRKGGVDNGKVSYLSSSYDPICSDRQGVPQSPPSIHKEVNEKTESSSMLVGANSRHYEGETSMVLKMQERYLQDLVFNQPVDENETNQPVDENETGNVGSKVEESKINERGDLGFDGEKQNTISILEQELQEEHAARAALFLELEKERNASATAADEAMAMILRLQEEKASIVMEARQYQRIIEEKSTYDAEEMNILKEILLRREREKHFLEKEVEAYRQMMDLGNEQLEGDVPDLLDTRRQQLPSSLVFTEDTDLMLHQLSQSIGKKKLLKSRSFSGLPIQEWNDDSDFSKQGDVGKQFSQDSECINHGNQPKDGKTLETYLNSYDSCSSLETNLPEKTITVVGEEQVQNGDFNLLQGVEKKTVESRNETGTNIRDSGQIFEELGQNDNLMFDKELHVHDVHVNDDESKLCDESYGNKAEQPSVNDTSNVHRRCDFLHEDSVSQMIDIGRDFPSTSRSDNETERNNSSSGTTIGLPLAVSRGISLRRNSTSTLDSERVKIDNEVEWLRERLRIVQEGREKLDLSTEHREREDLQLQLLEDITRQLQEIRLLTEPGKVRQVSLPPPSSKDMSKKRRWRSVPLGLQKSSEGRSCS